jgi:membrane-bound lytic murein transglycosylase B
MTRARRRASPFRRLLSTLLATVILGSAGAVAAYALAREADLPQVDMTRIPHVAYEAYLSAAERAPEVAEGCALDWAILAGVARVESKHGQMDGAHVIDADGRVTPPIRGVALDGTGGTKLIPDTDGGALDDDATWDRAMGPFQFIPTSWAQFARDGNGDGIADPDNIHDAALSAVAHLCLRQPGDLASRGELRRALLRYNASGRYADLVLGWIDRYRDRPLNELLADIPTEG